VSAVWAPPSISAILQRCCMDPNRFTEKMKEALRSAQSRAIRQSHQQLDVEHLLAALLEQESGLAGAILAKAGVSTELLGQRLEQELERVPTVKRQTGAARDESDITSEDNRVGCTQPCGARMLSLVQMD